MTTMSLKMILLSKFFRQIFQAEPQRERVICCQADTEQVHYGRATTYGQFQN